MLSLFHWIPHTLTGDDQEDDGNTLNLAICLRGGQSFSWIKEGHFYMNLSDIFEDKDDITTPIVLSQKSMNTVLFWLPPSYDEGKTLIRRENLIKYFRLYHSLPSLYQSWMTSKIFKQSLTNKDLWGIRLLDQRPYETVISFICSQNNAIPRISKMVLRLKDLYGSHKVVVGDLPMERSTTTIMLSSIPEPSSIVGKVERLKEEKFGYRARYLDETSKAIAEGSLKLENLIRKKYNNNEDYSQVCKELQQKCPGIGPKVADCIALMGLRWTQVIPIDVHMKRVAIKASTKPLVGITEMSHFLRSSLGEMAGWAHLIMFANQLLLKKS